LNQSSQLLEEPVVGKSVTELSVIPEIVQCFPISTRRMKTKGSKQSTCDQPPINKSPKLYLKGIIIMYPAWSFVG
jgi:hypothetical protein